MTEPHPLRLAAGDEPCLELRGFGTARADLATIASMRKSLPAWVPAETPGHFLKHADEQTVVAVAAVDQAIRSAGLRPCDYQDWSIIAAPRFIGRLAGTTTLARFTRGGGPAISPHLIPQHSLHSISGALSILLASRRPNFGIGGASESLAEGLLAALTFPASGCSGAWLVATGWDPEPQIDEQGRCTNAPLCHAAALAFEPTVSAFGCGQLRLLTNGGPIADHPEVRWFDHAAGLAQCLAALTPGGAAQCFAWRLPWGAIIVLDAREAIAGLSVAA
jgi:hypothetical protein